MGFPFFAERELMTNFAGHCLTCQKDRIVQNVAGMNIWSKYRIEYKELVSLGLPVLVTQAGIIVVSFADTMMVGAHSTDELAAAAFVNSLFVVATVMMIGFAAGMIPLVGALFGRGDSSGAGRTLKAGLQVNVSVASVFTVIMGCLYFFLDCFGQPAELLPIVRPYYLTVLCSLVPMSVFNTFQQTSNALNSTKMPMWIILTANVLNIIGNYVLIFGHAGFPELGLLGAGISTLFARVVAACIIVAVFRGKMRYRPYVDAFKDAGSLAPRRLEVWETSYPVMIQNGIECALWTLGAIVCGWFGKLQLAAYQVVNTMAQLGFMTYISFGVATSIRIANAMGISDFQGIRRSASAGLHITLLLATLASAVFILAGKGLIGLFTPDVGVVGAARLLIVPLVLYQYGDAVQLTYANALRGTGDVKPLLWVAVVAYVLVGVPSMLALGDWLGFGSVGVYYSFSLALIVASLLLWLSFRGAVNRRERIKRLFKNHC